MAVDDYQYAEFETKSEHDEAILRLGQRLLGRDNQRGKPVVYASSGQRYYFERKADTNGVLANHLVRLAQLGSGIIRAGSQYPPQLFLMVLEPAVVGIIAEAGQIGTATPCAHG